MNTGTYFKLAEWDDRSMTFRDGKRGFDTVEQARAAAVKSGRYRISTVTEAGRTDGEPFTVAGGAAGQDKPKPRAGGLRSRPGPWTRT